MTILTTANELEDLPEDSLVLSGDEVYRKLPSGYWRCLDDALDLREWQEEEPSTVLWQGHDGIFPAALLLHVPASSSQERTN